MHLGGFHLRTATPLSSPLVTTPGKTERDVFFYAVFSALLFDVAPITTSVLGKDTWKTGNMLVSGREPGSLGSGEGGRFPASAPWIVRSELSQMCSICKALSSSGPADTAGAA